MHLSLSADAFPFLHLEEKSYILYLGFTAELTRADSSEHPEMVAEGSTEMGVLPNRMPDGEYETTDSYAGGGTEIIGPHTVETLCPKKGTYKFKTF